MTTSANEERIDTRKKLEEAPATTLTARTVQRRNQLLADWSEFGEYSSLKYPDELDEGLIALIEHCIEERGILSV